MVFFKLSDFEQVNEWSKYMQHTLIHCRYVDTRIQWYRYTIKIQKIFSNIHKMYNVHKTEDFAKNEIFHYISKKLKDLSTRPDICLQIWFSFHLFNKFHFISLREKKLM